MPALSLIPARLAALATALLAPRLKPSPASANHKSSPLPRFILHPSSFILFALCLAPSLPAAQIYVDAVGGAGGNTYNNNTNSLDDWWTATSSSSDNKWTLRTTGPAAVAYNSTCYEINSTPETDVPLRTEITGLTPNKTYTDIRVYVIGRATSTTGNSWHIDASVDGTNWQTLIDFDDVGYTGTQVDTSDNGVGATITSAITEKRVWYALPDATTNASGTLKIYIRRGTGTNNRSDYDGIGYDNDSAVTPPDTNSNSVYISEFMADNPSPVFLPGTVADMDGDTSDWIELHNSGANTADLSGWKLTDDPLVPAKWTFPSGTTLNANTRLLVFASGKNRRVSGVEFHTNFKLSNSGFLQLSRAATSGPDVVLSSFDSKLDTYPAQNPRASYGSTTTTPGALSYGYFATPTPRLANASTSVPDFVKGTTTDIDRGIFTTAFPVTITCPTPGATVLYTTNGSVPVQGASGTTAVPPADSLSLPVATVNITGTTILRTRAVKTGFGPSKTDSHTYLFPAQVLTQTAPPANFPASAAWSHYGTSDWAMDPAIVNHSNAASKCRVEDLLSIPTISLVMDWSELFGTSGLYPAISPIPQEGYDRAASLELLNPDASTTTPNTGKDFAVEGVTHVFGGTSQLRWKVDKLSLNFNIQGTVSTDIYGDTATGTYGKFILDARMGNTWLHSTDEVQRTRGDYIRDEVSAEAQRKMGMAATHSRRIHLYLNGMYWGLYSLHEKPSADFQAAYQGGDSDDWDVLKHNPALADCLDSGTFVNPAISATVKTNNTAYVNYQAMLATVAAGVDLTNSANYAAVATKLDIDDFIDYMVHQFALNNYDWSHQNWYASYRRTSPDGRWRFHSWDAEHILRTDTEENIAASISGTGAITPLTDCNQVGTPTGIHQRLSTNAEYRMKFADRIQKWCFHGGILTTAGTTAICNRQFAEIDAAIRAESARWGDNRAPARPAPNTNVTYTRGVEWLNEKNRMLGLIPNRFNVFLNSMKSKANALYPRLNPADTASAIFQAPAYSQHGDRVAANYSLAITNPNGATGTIYYTLDGTDPRLTGGALNPAALTYSAPLTLTTSVTVRSRVRNGTNWSALNEAAFSVGTVAPSATNLLISKIMWKPGTPTSDEVAAGFSDDSDFEFLELYNPSANSVDLNGIAFTAGLDIEPYGTGPSELAPGARAVLVAKPSAFLLRYGNNAQIVGKFINGSNLSGSENLTLVDSLGTTIQSFTYNDPATGPWPKSETSGTGACLVLVSPETLPATALGSSWRASFTANPAPGTDDRPNLTAWQTTNFGGPTDLNADPDHDGLPNLLEFALALNPNTRDTNRLPTVSLLPGDLASGTTVLTVAVRRQRFLESLIWTIEYADNLGTWSTTPGVVETLSTDIHGDRTETVTYRTIVPAATQARFLRLRVTQP